MALEAPLKLVDSDVEEFLPGIIQSKIHWSHLEKIHAKYQVLPEFEMEVPLEFDQACDPPLGRIVLYKECFPTESRLPLFPFFVDLH